MSNVRTASAVAATAAALFLTLASCIGDATGPSLPSGLEFSIVEIDFGTEVQREVILRNNGSTALGPVLLVGDPIRDGGGIIPLELRSRSPPPRSRR